MGAGLVEGRALGACQIPKLRQVLLQGEREEALSVAACLAEGLLLEVAQAHRDDGGLGLAQVAARDHQVGDEALLPLRVIDLVDGVHRGDHAAHEVPELEGLEGVLEAGGDGLRQLRIEQLLGPLALDTDLLDLLGGVEVGQAQQVGTTNVGVPRKDTVAVRVVSRDGYPGEDRGGELSVSGLALALVEALLEGGEALLAEREELVAEVGLAGDAVHTQHDAEVGKAVVVAAQQAELRAQHGLVEARGAQPRGEQGGQAPGRGDACREGPGHLGQCFSPAQGLQGGELGQAPLEAGGGGPLGGAWVWLAGEQARADAGQLQQRKPAGLGRDQGGLCEEPGEHRRERIARPVLGAKAGEGLALTFIHGCRQGGRHDIGDGSRQAGGAGDREEGSRLRGGVGLPQSPD